MRICVIVNENAGSADQSDALRKAAAQRDDVVCWQSMEPGDGVALAEKAAREGFEVVAAAGGDGTINEVVNGLMQVEERPVLGVLPLGTGNDFARMLSMPSDDPIDALALLSAGERRSMDVYALHAEDEIKYGINASAGGFSGQVNEALTSDLKASWGPLAYLIGAAAVLPDLQDYETYLKLDGGEPERIFALNIVVANGRTVAGGKRVAPLANPEDGMLDVVVIENGSVVELADVATRLVAGKLAASRVVRTFRARHVEVTSDPGMWFNLDGELVTKEPIVIEAIPGALRVVVGTRYQAVVEP